MKTLLTTLISLSLLMIALQFFQDDLVFKRTEIDHGEWWRIITGNFVHTNYPHLALNLTGLWIMGFLFSDSFNAKKILMSTVFLSIVTGLLLYWFSRELDWYAGARERFSVVHAEKTNTVHSKIKFLIILKTPLFLYFHFVSLLYVF